MADSDIIVSGLTATAGVGHITLAWTGPDVSCLPYLLRDVFEVWASASNNRDAASKIAEVPGYGFLHAGLAALTRRYYWVRAKNASGTFGDFHPLSSAAGVTAITLQVAAGEITGQITETQISDSAISTPKLAANAVTANKIQAGTITATQIAAGTITAAQIATGTITATQISTGTITATQIAGTTITGDKIAAGAITATQIAAGTITATQIAAGAVTAGKISVSSLDAISATLGNVTVNGALVVNGSISTLKYEFVSIINAAYAINTNDFNIGSSPSDGSVVAIACAGGKVFVKGTAVLFGNSGDQTIRMYIFKNGGLVLNEAVTTVLSGKFATGTLVWQDNAPGVAVNTYSLALSTQSANSQHVFSAISVENHKNA